MARMDENSRRRRFRFSLRTLLELVAVAAFVLTLFYYRPSAVGEKHGRYQLEIIRDADNPIGSQQWVIDTETGEVWRLDGAQWRSRGKAPPHRQ
jgi:hypothetical protein